MNLQGERLIPAPVELTWAALNDPDTLKACIAGCESIERTGENEFVAVTAVRIGPVNARFKGRLQLTDIEPLSAYTIRFDGQGGVAGFGRGSARVTLLPDAVGTRLSYVSEAQVGGKLAQVGSRLVDSAAAKIAEDFFRAFEARVGMPTTVEVAIPAIPAIPAGAAGEPGAALAAAGGSRVVWWIVAALAAAAIVVWWSQ
jgi:carbon monoxide dehydrogenase subunit G